MSFTAEVLAPRLARLPQGFGYLVAFSGGGDSAALLHALSRARPGVRAIHVVHGLHPDADRWARHCAALCRRLDVPLETARARVDAGAGKGLEAAARRARYACFAESLREDEILLTAHTRDDQAETVLLRLLRGTGLSGLAGMPRLRRFGPGWLARPLLDVTRAELRGYLERHGESWLEDPDNANIARSRVYLRREILPRLRTHWPAADRVIARAADNLSESASALSEYTERELAELLTPSGEGLQVAPLYSMPEARRRMLLRHWLALRGLPEPSRVSLEELETQLLDSRDDAEPRVAWPGAEVRRYREAIHAFVPAPPPDPEASFEWHTEKPLELPADLGRLRLAGGDRPAPNWRLTVAFRRGGERIRLPDRAHHTELKNLFQQWGVPPWERDRLPLVFENGTLCSVADLQPSHGFRERLEGAGVALRWDRPGARVIVPPHGLR